MLVECTRCGAPLDVKSDTRLVRCSYCGSSNRVKTMRTIAMVAPAGWSPPKTWTPPNRGAPLPYREPPKQVSIGALITGIVLLTLLVVLCPLLLLPIIIAGGLGLG